MAGLKRHYDETKNLKFRERLVFKTAGYKQELISTDPYILSLQVCNMHSNNPAFLDILITEIRKAMSANGCNKDDYSIEVKYHD